MGTEASIPEFIFTTYLLLAALAGGIWFAWRSLLKDHSSFYNRKKNPS